MGLSSILLVGLVLKTAGFLVRDELVLRAFVIGGMACDISFFYFQPDPISGASGSLSSPRVD